MIAMCGRFTLHQDTSDVAKSIGALDLSVVTPFLPSYNIAPSQEVPVILNRGLDFRNQEHLHMRLMTWGLRPAWSSGGNQNPINAYRAVAFNSKSLRCIQSISNISACVMVPRLRHAFRNVSIIHSIKV